MSLQSKWVRSFRVELCSGKVERNVYIFKVTSTLFPHGSPEAATEIIVYKHLSDFIRLHALLKRLYLSLFPLKGHEFPILPSGPIDCHSDRSMMEERRLQSLFLLEYSSRIPQLYNSDIFTSFTMTNSACNCKLECPLDETYQVEECELTASPGAKAESEELGSIEVDKQSLICGSPSVEEMLFLAEMSEEKSEINESVSHYKKAIKKLLDRAKMMKEENPLVSKGLSKRASGYLQKVESLIKKPDRRRDEGNMETKTLGSSGSTRVPYSDLFGDVKDLNRYKVTGVLADRNIIAMDTRRGNMKVVLKTLQKSSIVLKSGKTSLLPINIRFMVKLICYYETDDFIYLVLENVQHGRIYDLIAFIFSCPYSLLESNHLKSHVNGHHFLNVVESAFAHSSDDEELTRVEFRKNSLFCLDKDGIEDISFANEEEEELEDSENNIELGEEVLGPHFLNYRTEAQVTKKANKRKDKGSQGPNPPASVFLFDIFPGSANKESLLPLPLLRKWTFQMCQVLFGLHARNIIIKDLNPNNLLLDESCDLKLTYQCQWVSVDKPLSSEAFEGGYIAPELSYVEPLTPTCDWWSVGVILFELSSGVYFSELYPSGLLSHTPVSYPNQIAHLIDDDLKDFVGQLIQPIPHLRLGAGTEGHAAIKGHPFLKMYDLKS